MFVVPLLVLVSIEQKKYLGPGQCLVVEILFSIVLFLVMKRKLLYRLIRKCIENVGTTHKTYKTKTPEGP